MAKKTLFVVIKPRRHLVGVLAFDDMVLSDLAIPCDVFGRVRDPDGQPLYDCLSAACGEKSGSEHLSLEVPWRISRLQRASTIIVPSISPVDRLVPDELIRALQRAIARGRPCDLHLLRRVRACPYRVR